ncbi:dATP pyrophosphohydrolase [Silvimonas terrae]|uniref:dATP pyrophosphohydrolase n=1 Tax=Silvimonas terrae TaxID=300266 RepID=A0A840RBZ2_9NEIS|nr:dihydroneopterin triphosphate diphosphatase [Silvimonas terrae]MBB5190457.1 dATP pyrophosphohydrolase [Silvimonas terrae]
MAYKQPISVLVVIHTPDLQILLLERKGYADGWQSVTGSREGEELLPDTAHREVFEETGLDTNRYELADWHYSSDYEIYPVWRYRYAPGVTINTEHVFSLQVPFALDITLAADEHTRYRWVEWQVAAEMVFSPSNAEAIRTLAGQRSAPR